MHALPLLAVLALPAQTFPPRLPDGKAVVTDTSPQFLVPPAGFAKGVPIVRVAPTIDLLYFPGQDYAGKPWSNWGEGLAVGGKVYLSIGDHLAPGGNAFIYEYDVEKKELRRVVDVRAVLGLPAGHYTPGKVHGRLDLASDGWIYFSTHRGSTRATSDANRYEGDWILRYHPGTGKSEVVVRGPVPKHCIPASVVDPERRIFYGATAPGDSGKPGIHFFAYDLKARKLLHAAPGGPARSIILAKSTGRVYFTPGHSDGPVMRYDPAKGGAPVAIAGKLEMRAVSQETPAGIVYTVSTGKKGASSTLYAFHTRTEKVEEIGPAAVGSATYIASISADPTGRWLYYVPGAHGNADRDGSPLVRFDTKTKKREVVAFLHAFYQKKYGVALKGTYSVTVGPGGDKVFVNWNANRSGGRAWDCCALTVVHLPEAIRRD